MSNKQKKHQIVVSVYPTGRGMGFSVFDTPKNLIDWGYCDFRMNKTARTLKKVGALLDVYKPEILVLEDTKADDSKRLPRIKKLTDAITEFAVKKQVPVKHHSVSDIALALPADNKDRRAKDITKVLPELESYLPPERRIWDPQHPRMQIFEAVSLAITFFYFET